MGVVSLTVGAGVNGWFMLPDIGYPATSGYGRMVAAKIALFAGMLALAGHNRRVLVPRFAGAVAETDSSAAAARLKRNIALELTAGAAVLVLISVLGITAP